MTTPTTNIIIGGLGGQGVITTSDILAVAAFHQGFDVKKSDVHGMAQRGGTVASDVRFGSRVLSPMIPRGEADFIVVLHESQVDFFRSRLGPRSQLISLAKLDGVPIDKPKSANLAMLAALAQKLRFSGSAMEAGIRHCLKPALQADGLRLFREFASHFSSRIPQQSGSVERSEASY